MYWRSQFLYYRSQLVLRVASSLLQAPACIERSQVGGGAIQRRRRRDPKEPAGRSKGAGGAIQRSRRGDPKEPAGRSKEPGGAIQKEPAGRSKGRSKGAGGAIQRSRRRDPKADPKQSVGLYWESQVLYYRRQLVLRVANSLVQAPACTESRNFFTTGASLY